MTLAIALQWGLLVGFAMLLPAAVVAGHYRPAARPWSFAVGVMAVTHGAYYALFLVWPDVLGAQETMLFSITLRYMVMFLIAFVLVLALKDKWNK